MLMVKICLCCGEEFSKPYVESKRVWAMRHKFCSRQCADTDKLGKNVIDISGQRFGRLIVLARGDAYVSPKGKRQTQWKCQCDCGAIKTIPRPALISGAVVSCGCFNKENAQRLGLSNTRENNGMFGAVGSLNPHYNPSLTTEYRLNRRTVSENIAWGKAVKERDNYTCQVCLIRGGQLHSHHKEPFALNKETRYDITIGITLCKDCHNLFHKIYGDDCNGDNFIEFQTQHGLIAAA